MLALTAGLNDKPRIANFCCVAISRLAEALQPVDQNQEANQLTPYYTGLLETLFRNSSREDL